MLSILYTLFMIALLFGLTIFVHEFGHFLMARRLGLVVEAFSIGLGPAIWKRKRNGVTYKIGVIPFGGYVALPQMDPTRGLRLEGATEQRNLPPAPPWKRILVSLSGVAGNLLLAIVLAWVVYLGGKSYAPEQETATIGYVDPESEAYKVGLRIGETIEAVQGQAVRTWDEVLMFSALSTQPVLRVRGADGFVREVSIPTERFLGARYLPGVFPVNFCWVLNVEPGSSAERAGIRPRDRIVELDGVVVMSREHLMDEVAARRDRTVPIVVERKGQRLTLEVTPTWDEARGRARIGVVFNTLDVKRPMAQIKTHALLILRLLRALVTPGRARAAAGSVGGPVAILALFWIYVRSSLLLALWYTCMLNVNLAILNILPIPVLDGGHIIFAAWETVFRRPIPPRIFNAIMNAFTIMIVLLFLVLMYRESRQFVLPLFQRAGPEAEQHEEHVP